MIARRQFISLLGGAAVAWPVAARGQQVAPLIGYVAGGKQSVVADLVNAFWQGMREFGYVEGRNIRVAYRFAEGQVARLPVLAEEIVRLNPAVVLAGAVDAVVAIKNVNTTIPIVSPTLADAIHLGLVASYARPGGNVTGLTPYVDGLPSKQMDIALELVPGARRVGLLGNMNDPKAPPQRDELKEALRARGIDVTVPEVRGPEDIDGAMRAFRTEHIEVAIVLQTTMILSERKAIAALANANGLPMVFGYRQHVDEGGLISYGVDLRWCFHRAAAYVDKILKGAAPRDLPVEFPSRLQMVINLKTAKTLGLTISDKLLVAADEVIE